MIKGFSSWDDSTFFEHKKDRISKYRSIFIDEVQDYKTEWLELIVNYFLAEDGELVVFGDEKTLCPVVYGVKKTACPVGSVPGPVPGKF